MSIVGEKYKIIDLSYIKKVVVTKSIDPSILSGKVATIVSDPFEETVNGITGSLFTHTFILVEVKGNTYRVIFDQNNILFQELEQLSSYELLELSDKINKLLKSRLS